MPPNPVQAERHSCTDLGSNPDSPPHCVDGCGTSWSPSSPSTSRGDEAEDCCGEEAGRAQSGRVSDSVLQMEAGGGWRARLTPVAHTQGVVPSQTGNGASEMLSQRAEVIVNGQDEDGGRAFGSIWGLRALQTPARLQKCRPHLPAPILQESGGMGAGHLCRVHGQCETELVWEAGLADLRDHSFIQPKLLEPLSHARHWVGWQGLKPRTKHRPAPAWS